MTQSHHPSPSERIKIAERLGQVKAYGEPRRVWVEDGHVFVEGHEGTVVSMTPEVAIQVGRLLSNAGSESLVNKVMGLVGDPEISAPLPR